MEHKSVLTYVRAWSRSSKTSTVSTGTWKASSQYVSTGAAAGVDFVFLALALTEPSRSAMNLALSRLFGHNSRTSWVGLRRRSRKRLKESDMSAERVRARANQVHRVRLKETQ
jgi:hypothetical protein